MANEDIRETLWENEVKEGDFADNQKGLTIRRKLFSLLTYVRSRDLRDRVAGLSFGDMLQEAIVNIDSAQRTEGDVAAKTQRHPNDPELEPRDQGLSRGKLQELEELEKIANGVPGKKPDGPPAEKGVFELMAELAKDEILSSNVQQGAVEEEDL